MEDYKVRMINEYKEVKERYQRLHTMLVRFDAGRLDFKPTCPIDLLREQAAVMGKYLYILEERAVIEDIELKEKDIELKERTRGKAMTITVELEVSSPYDFTVEEIEKDLRMAEDQIGWNYDYVIKSVEVT